MRWIKRKTPKRPGPYLIAANEFGTYCLPRRGLHRPACQAILKGKVWEVETVSFLMNNAKGDIIHGGTFFGDFLPALSRSYEHVWAFEPNCDSFTCAEVTVRLNKLGNVTLRNSGMGKAAGTATLCTERNGEYLGGKSFIANEGGDTRIEAIDSVVPSDRQIGVIHLDVERYEHAALEGALQTIKRWQPIIVLETVPPLISEIGYREVGRINENYIFRS